MAKKLFIGNLPWAASDEDLAAHFGAAGAVASAKVMRDKITGKSRGFGFVEFDSDSDADKAIETLNGADFMGRNLTVNEARPLEKRD